MLKFVILYMAIAIAQSSDIDPYLVNSLIVAMSPKLNGSAIGCYWWTARVVDVQCACGNDTETSHVKLLSYRHVPGNGTSGLLAVSVVNTTAEVVDALTKYNTCKCGEKSYRYGVYRPVNDKFYAEYFMYPVEDKRIISVLIAKSEVTKSEIKKAIQLVDDLKNGDFSFICD